MTTLKAIKFKNYTSTHVIIPIEHYKNLVSAVAGYDTKVKLMPTKLDELEECVEGEK